MSPQVLLILCLQGGRHCTILSKQVVAEPVSLASCPTRLASPVLVLINPVSPIQPSSSISPMDPCPTPSQEIRHPIFQADCDKGSPPQALPSQILSSCRISRTIQIPVHTAMSIRSSRSTSRSRSTLPTTTAQSRFSDAAPQPSFINRRSSRILVDGSVDLTMADHLIFAHHTPFRLLLLGSILSQLLSHGRTAISPEPTCCLGLLCVVRTMMADSLGIHTLRNQ